jgi:hypothetical protein
MSYHVPQLSYFCLTLPYRYLAAIAECLMEEFVRVFMSYGRKTAEVAKQAETRNWRT